MRETRYAGGRQDVREARMSPEGECYVSHLFNCEAYGKYVSLLGGEMSGRLAYLATCAGDALRPGGDFDCAVWGAPFPQETRPAKARKALKGDSE